MKPLTHILESCLYVDDLDESERFYRDVLGLRHWSRKASIFTFFKLEGGMLLLFRPDTGEAPSEIPAHGAIGPGHLCFSAKNDELPGWREHLEAHGVVIEHEHTWPTGGRSIYFRDPAGNSIEIGSPSMWAYDEPE